MADKTKSKTKSNKKRRDAAAESNEGSNLPLLKKNELFLIVCGACAITVIIFFIFFRPTGAQRGGKDGTDVSQSNVNSLKKQISQMEGEDAAGSGQMAAESFEDSTAAGSASAKDDSVAESYAKRVERVEEALSVKFEALVKRIDRLERSIDALSEKVAAVAAQRDSRPVKKQAVKINKKKPILHTVKKGETLYSISRDYDTTVTKLRELNNLEAGADIYPGDNLVVR